MWCVCARLSMWVRAFFCSLVRVKSERAASTLKASRYTHRIRQVTCAFERSDGGFEIEAVPLPCAR